MEDPFYARAKDGSAEKDLKTVLLMREVLLYGGLESIPQVPKDFCRTARWPATYRGTSLIRKYPPP